MFEVDHPATQQVKLDRLKKIFGRVPAHVTFVAIDFSSETLDKLFASGFDKNKKSLIVWEGVAYYLSAQAVDATLSFVAQNTGVGSLIIFDYAYADALLGQNRRNEVKSMQRYRRFTGEALVFGIERGCIEEFLKRRGFDEVVNVDSDWFRQNYYANAKPVATSYAIVHASVARTSTKEKR